MGSSTSAPPPSELQSIEVYPNPQLENPCRQPHRYLFARPSLRKSLTVLFSKIEEPDFVLYARMLSSVIVSSLHGRRPVFNTSKTCLIRKVDLTHRHDLRKHFIKLYLQGSTSNIILEQLPHCPSQVSLSPPHPKPPSTSHTPPGPYTSSSPTPNNKPH